MWVRPSAVYYPVNVTSTSGHGPGTSGRAMHGGIYDTVWPWFSACQ